jgi:hypothetical protein
MENESEDSPEPLQLGHLSGAVLTYEDGEGNEVIVEFDE